MRDTLLELCKNFIQNKNIIKSVFKWDNSLLYPACSIIFTDKRKTADADNLRECRKILKRRAGVFSNFRGNAKLMLISIMSLDSAPEEKLEKSLQVYRLLKEHFFTSEYLPLVSMVIVDTVAQSQYEEITARTRRIYDLMKEKHPFLTSSNDSVFALILALSKLTDQQIIEETEKCYKILKSKFFYNNSIQSLSHILALGEGTAEEKCDKTISLYYKLKEKGYRYGHGHELSTIGIQALLPTSIDTIVNEIIEVDEFLSKQKGCGVFSLSRKQRLMYAGLLVSSDYMGQVDNKAITLSSISGTISMVAMQQAVLCAVIASSTTVHINSNSSTDTN